MKRIYLATLSIIFMFSIYAQTPEWEKRIQFNHLTLIGKCIYNDATLGKVTVEVYEKDSLIYTFKTDFKRDNIIRLPLNSEFTIELSKRGFVTKRAFINTNTPYPEDNYKPIEMDIVMIPFKKHVDYSALEKPVTIVKYSSKTGQYEFDADYSKEMLDEQNKIMNQLYVSKN